LVSAFLTFPKSVSPVTQILQASEIRKCGSSYINLPLFKSKIELNIYRPEYNIRVQSIIITNYGRQKPLPISSNKSFMEDPFLPQLHSWCSSFGTTLERSNKSWLLPHLKTTWDKALSMELLSKSYPTKEKTLKGMLAFRE
jgi:hypothetical protein